MFGYIIYLVEQTWNGLSAPYCSPLGYTGYCPTALSFGLQPAFRCLAVLTLALESLTTAAFARGFECNGDISTVTSILLGMWMTCPMTESSPSRRSCASPSAHGTSATTF